MKKIAFFTLVCVLFVIFASPLCMAQSTEEYPDTDFDGYIVKLSYDSAGDVRLMSQDGLEPLVGDARLFLADSPETVLSLDAEGALEYFEPNYAVYLMDVPNDTYYSKQWNLKSINASAAWDRNYSGEGVRVAIIDSGINTLHEDLEGVSITNGINVIDSSSNVSDQIGHGSFIAGIIAAKRDNGTGIAGMTDKVELVPIKCFSDSKTTSLSYIITAMYKAVDDYHCSVINLSLGLSSDTAAFRECVDYAVEKGAIIVSAVGNSGNSQLLYPAAYYSVIGVGSIGRLDALSSFSNYNESVHVVAPGESLTSISKDDNSGYRSGGSGTSYATPHVTAMAVMAKSRDPSITAAEFARLLAASSKDLGDPGYDEKYGYGKIDVESFLDELEDVPKGSFTDIRSHWAQEYINYVADKNLFSGVSESEFSPDTNMSRAMTVTVLARMSGADLSGLKTDFSDVMAGQWFYGSVAWGQSSGIVAGTDQSHFTPHDNVSREQMAVFMYRYAMTLGHSDGSFSGSGLAKFTDVSKISSWAYNAVAWAVDNGLLQGRTNTSLDPGGAISRAEVATIIYRFVTQFA